MESVEPETVTVTDLKPSAGAAGHKGAPGASRSGYLTPAAPVGDSPASSRSSSPWEAIAYTLTVLTALYFFLFSIDLMSSAFKLLGVGFASGILRTTSDPLAGLLLGFLVTSLVQSSSFTTALTVGLVAAGTLPLNLAIPVIMGANIGTTVTNTIVSLGHVRRQQEFERAFAAGTVHDFFNVLAAATLFPIELLFHPIEKAAVWLGETFAGLGGLELVSPLQAAIKPATNAVSTLIPHPLPLLLLQHGQEQPPAAPGADRSISCPDFHSAHDASSRDRSCRTGLRTRFVPQ